MNLQQLEYIVAVDIHRHFVRAAQHCYVTQPTLSSMIQKLEEELDVKIFDRSKQPVIPTESGKEIIAQARIILSETARMKEIVQGNKNEIRGELRLGVIPTLAPYVLPLFLKKFADEYPEVEMVVMENNTETIIQKLKEQALDAGLLATPLGHSSIKEEVLFYERFFAYISDHTVSDKQYILVDEIDVNSLWLLEEGHCMRTQVMNLCALRDQRHVIPNVAYEAGSLETLKRMVERNQGATILPELALLDMPKDQMKRVRFFRDPCPTREISLVTYQHFVKENLLRVLRQSILESLPASVRNQSSGNRLSL
jgi:LysR family transcriptional regulator, hydrogen peroxide-inducible genes activator